MEVGVKNKAFLFWKPSKGNVLFCSRRHLTWAISRHELKSSSMTNIHSFSPVGQSNATVSALELPSERLHGGQRVARLADKKQIQPAH